MASRKFVAASEWWPRVIDVRCEGLEEGCVYRQVYKSPTGVIETDVSVERLDDCHELRVRCLNTGTYTRWLMTPAQGGTFIDAEFGLDPQTIGTRVFDHLAGKRYFRRWLEESLDALERVVAAARLPDADPPSPHRGDPSGVERIRVS